MVAECTAGSDVVAVPTQRRGGHRVGTLAAGLATAFVHGIPVDWAGSLAGARRVDLPTYAFQGRRYWLEREAPAEPAPADSVDGRLWDIVGRRGTGELAVLLDLPEDAALGELLPALSSWRTREQAAETGRSWRYDVRWEPWSGVREGAPLPGRWLVIHSAAEAALCDAVAAALSGQGAEVVLRTVDAKVPDRADLAAWLAASGGADGFAGVVSLFGATPHGKAEDRDDCAALVYAAACTTALVQALGEAGVEAPLWCVTAGAVSVTGEELAGAVGAAMWGLGGVIDLEHPRRWGGLVDLPAAQDSRSLAALPGVLAAAGAEDQIAVRPLGMFARRLTHVPAGSASARPTRSWRTRGTALITGGTGALGTHAARWLVAHGAGERDRQRRG